MRIWFPLNTGQTSEVNIGLGLGGGTEGRLKFARVYKGSTSEYLHTLSIPPASQNRAGSLCPRQSNAGGDCGVSDEAIRLRPSLIPTRFVDTDEALEHEKPHWRNHRAQANDQPQRPRMARASVGTEMGQQHAGEGRYSQFGQEEGQRGHGHIGGFLSFGGNGCRVFIESRGLERLANREQHDK